jgi:hypothetical protein
MTSDVSRREAAATAAAGAAGLLAMAGAASAQPPATPAEGPGVLRSEFLFDLILETGGPGGGAVGNRQIVPVIGGTFEGPKLKGRVIPPGADWLVRVNDTLRILDIRTLLLTDDEQRIYLTYRGVLYTPPGQPRHQRVLMMFETASEKYAWLQNMVAVGVGYTVSQRVPYHVFQIL